MENAINKTVQMMLETMEKLKAGKCDSKTATAMAGAARIVIESAKTENDFIRTVRALPQGGIWGKNVTYLEPNVEIDEETKLRKPKRIALKASDEFGGPSAKEWH